jgi:hypothetical protein
MQNQQAHHCNAEAGATHYFRSNRRYTLMQKQQALTFNSVVAGATLKCRSSRCCTVMQK